MGYSDFYKVTIWKGGNTYKFRRGEYLVQNRTIRIRVPRDLWNRKVSDNVVGYTAFLSGDSSLKMKYQGLVKSCVGYEDYYTFSVNI